MPNSRAHSLFELSFRAKRGICFFLVLAFLFVATSVSAQAQPKHLRITGIVDVNLSTSDVKKTETFFTQSLGLQKCEAAFFTELCVSIGNGQTITADNACRAEGPCETNYLYSVTFMTENAEELRSMLKDKGYAVSELRSSKRSGNSFVVIDPDKHRIGFTEGRYDEPSQSKTSRIGVRVIHVGLIVHDRPAMAHFYKDILGFRPYWHGGRTDERDDWVSLQLPDGSDWVEFMLSVPDDADKRTLGIANHIALGVTDIQAARAQLIKNGVTLTEEPKIGRGGKWQMNLYDPDGTRIEFMEFTPVQKPCCSEYTAPHPKP